MKSFRTDLTITPSANKVGLKNPVLTVGSCFADAIGLRLQHNKFPSLASPFGALYNPVSIHKTLQYAIYRESPSDHTYLLNNSVVLNYDFHSNFSAPERNEVSAQIQNLTRSSHYFLKEADWVMITYGTAWVYIRKDTGEIVANCHKMPASNFTKSLLTENEIVESFKILHESLLKFNPRLRIILTLSPVRHIKDTLELNSVSKAIVRVACHRIADMFTNVDYFPAYEMMMDDLRDYRFYKSDMLHPTEEAEDYIWEKFSECYFSQETRTFLKRWESILNSLAHKPFHPNTIAHQQFLEKIRKELEELRGIINVDDEIRIVSSQQI